MGKYGEKMTYAEGQRPTQKFDRNWDNIKWPERKGRTRKVAMVKHVSGPPVIDGKETPAKRRGR